MPIRLSHLTLTSLSRARRWPGFVAVLLAIEFLDEFVFGLREAAWPLIRDDLDLSYVQVGILIGAPGVVSGLVEPVLGILGDAGRRRAIILIGGVTFTAGLLATAAAPSFAAMLVAFVVLYPASGAFVSLSQASLMDFDPRRHEQLMARWTLAGSLGVVAGPLALGAGIFLGLGWREMFVAMALMSGVILLLARPHPFATAHEHEPMSFRESAAGAVRALRRGVVWRWLAILELSDLMLDVLLGFLALYLVDEAGASNSQAALAVGVWATVGLAGDALLIPLLERVPGVRYLRVSAVIVFVLFPLFLLVPWFWPKVAILAVLGLLNSGWYAIPQGRLYSTMPGQSGSVMAITSALGVVTYAVPVALGLIADIAGIGNMMWLLLLGPLVLVLGLPRHDTVALAETRE